MLQQTKRCWTIPCSRFRNSRSWILNLSVCVCEDVPDRQSTQGWLNKFVNVTHPMNPHSNTLDNFKRTCWSDAPRFPCFFFPDELSTTVTLDVWDISWWCHYSYPQSALVISVMQVGSQCDVLSRNMREKNPDIASFTPHARQSRLNVTRVQSQRAARWRVECDI